ncbi:MAG: hypothetical protein ACD_23C01013G0003 [uncultured bacterium]|nr:MAG: hypothetical protein ACD_23C01013G0003 [uncultured bacterium]
MKAFPCQLEFLSKLIHLGACLLPILGAHSSLFECSLGLLKFGAGDVILAVAGFTLSPQFVGFCFQPITNLSQAADPCRRLKQNLTDVIRGTQNFLSTSNQPLMVQPKHLIKKVTVNLSQKRR